MLEHGYGDRVHLTDGSHLKSLLARVGSPAVDHGQLPGLVREVYRILLDSAFDLALPKKTVEIPTRMVADHPDDGYFRGQLLDPDTNVVVCDIVRGGLVPSQVAFEMLCRVLDPRGIRLDHLTMSRVSNASGKVTGVDLHGSKIGGSVEGAHLILPDPMGATGTTAQRVCRHYRENFGEPASIVLVPMIATPEFLRAALAIDKAVVVCGRLDRGLSPPGVLAARPGDRWDEERGLNEHGYIVPGAGGVGEVLNNSWC